MSFDRIAENRIREAMEQGEFDNLPGAGEPLNLEEYFSTPEDLRMAYSVLKSANCRPLEVELLAEIARLERAVAAAPDEATREAHRRDLAHRRTELAILLERRPRSK
jgi:hypothetical protein